MPGPALPYGLTPGGSLRVQDLLKAPQWGRLVSAPDSPLQASTELWEGSDREQSPTGQSQQQQETTAHRGHGLCLHLSWEPGAQEGACTLSGSTPSSHPDPPTARADWVAGAQVSRCLFPSPAGGARLPSPMRFPPRTQECRVLSLSPHVPSVLVPSTSLP